VIAAERTGATAYAVELDPRYCDVILSRWESFTGQEAARVE
jgi:DNA modification methylase